MDNYSTKITILSVGKPYRIVNESTAEVTQGCTMFYLISDGFPNSPVNDGSGLLGLTPAKASMPVEFYSEAANVGVPCTADCAFSMRIASGKPVLVPSEIILSNNSRSSILSVEDASSDDKSSTKRGAKA